MNLMTLSGKIKKMGKAFLPPMTRQLSNYLEDFVDNLEQPTWKEAEAASLRSYDQSKLTQLVFDKTAIFAQDPLAEIRNEDLFLIASLGRVAAVRGRTLSIVDFGGACGAHYFLCKAAFPEISLVWHVVETEAMVQQAKGLETDCLRFFTSLEAATVSIKPDFVYTSGTLQCVPNPEDTLRSLVRLGAYALVLARLGLAPADRTIFTVHRHLMSINGRGMTPTGFNDELSSYPFQFPVRSMIEDTLSEAYSIVLHTESDPDRFPGIRKQIKWHNLLAIIR